MALTDEASNMIMPVAPMGGYGNNGFGGDWSSWIILLLIFGMFGNGGWGNGYGGNAVSYDFPWLMNGQQGINANTNAGFDHAATQNAISNLQTAVTSGFGDVATQLCGGFATVNATVNGAQNAVAQQLYTNQIADMERSYAAQTANTAGLTNLSAQLAQCCCDNRLATAQTQALVQSENCADRAALSDGIRDIIANQAANTQAILDKMCQQEIENLKTANSNLQTQVLMRDLAASQTAQTTSLIADNTAQTQYLVNRISPYPVPSYSVPNPYGYSNCGCNYGIA